MGGRSKWKGPLLDHSVLIAMSRPSKDGLIRIHSRRSVIVEDFVGFRFEVHNGNSYKTFTCTPMHVGHKFGEFSLTRKKSMHMQGKKKLAAVKQVEGEELPPVVEINQPVVNKVKSKTFNLGTMVNTGRKVDTGEEIATAATDKKKKILGKDVPVPKKL